MGKGWLSGNSTVKEYEPIENYDSAIAQAKANLAQLKTEIASLLQQKNDILSGNHDTLKSKADHLNQVIIEQHQLKNTILTGVAEVEDKNKLADDLLKKLSDERDLLTKEIADFEDKKNSAINSLNVRDSVLKDGISEIEQKKVELDNRELAIEQAEKQNQDAAERLIAISEELDARTASLDEKDNVLTVREANLATKSQQYRADYADFMQAKHDFEDEKVKTQAIAAQTVADLDDINKKVDLQKSLLIENSRVQVETAQKLEALRNETAQNQDMIANLTNLKNQLTTGAKNVTNLN